MKNKMDLVGLWIQKAEKDLLTAQHEMAYQDAVKESVCFHAQQTVEKALKGYLIYLDLEFNKTHEIGELISSCEKKTRK